MTADPGIAPAQRNSRETTHYPEPLGWVSDLSDDEFADIFGPSWDELTGRNVDHLIPDHSERAV